MPNPIPFEQFAGHFVTVNTQAAEADHLRMKDSSYGFVSLHATSWASTSFGKPSEIGHNLIRFIDSDKGTSSTCPLTISTTKGVEMRKINEKERAYLTSALETGTLKPEYGTFAEYIDRIGKIE